MEGELWRGVYALLKRLGKGRGVVRGVFSDAEIVAVYLWAVVHDRPVKMGLLAAALARRLSVEATSIGTDDEPSLAQCWRAAHARQS
jgi:hypothetical protein